MKKFYYKKEDTVDRKPIILERRNTVSQDVKEEIENRLSTRTTSLGSVDQLKGASLIPRIQNREIRKSVSEDVLSRGYVKNPGKVITERELAASKLYKTRKASINSKDSPQKVPKKGDSFPKGPKLKPVPVPHKDGHQTDSSCLFPQPMRQKNDLSPVTLKDPKFKPVPVKHKDRKKKSSCLYYCGIFTAISLCTIGILAAVTGLLYSEIYSDKNSTSHRLQESMIDLTNLIQNNSSIHEYHVLSNETLARKVSFESADYDSSDIKRSGSNLIESEDTNSVQFRQIDMTDLSRLIDNKQAEIKFQDRDTTIFEVNTGSSAEQENSIDNQEIFKEINSPEITMSESDGSNNLNTGYVPDAVPSLLKNEKYEETQNPPIYDVKKRENFDDITYIKQKNSDPSSDIEQAHNLFTNDHVEEMEVLEFDSENEAINQFHPLNFLEQGTDSLETMKNKDLESNNINIIGEILDKNTELEEKTNIQKLLNSEFRASKDSSDIYHDQHLNLSNEESSDGLEDHSTSSVLRTKFENESVTFSESTGAVMETNKNVSKPSLKLNQINVEFNTATVSSPKDKVVWKAGNPMKVSKADESELIDKEISSENLDASDNSKIKHDVEEILEVISEPGDEVQDPFDVNRNGDINVGSETSNSWVKHNSNIFKVKSEEGDNLKRIESQNAQEEKKPKETLRDKPSNMKVSLAEAMKHLQTLDVNNKLLTSRMKSVKPVVQNEKPSKLDDKQMKPLQTLDVDDKLLISRMKSVEPKAQRENPSKLSDKHIKIIQSLDVNNKFLTSRMKSDKLKDQREKPSKLSTKQIKKESISADRMQLLHNLRIALQGNLMEL